MLEVHCKMCNQSLELRAEQFGFDIKIYAVPCSCLPADEYCPECLRHENMIEDLEEEIEHLNKEIKNKNYEDATELINDLQAELDIAKNSTSNKLEDIKKSLRIPKDEDK